MKPRVVNFFGGPGSGKSTMAARLFSELKFLGHTPELCQEWVKESAYEGIEWNGEFVSRIHFMTKNQLYILSKQLLRMNKMKDHVDFIITDSPLLLTLAYAPQEELDAGMRDLCLYYHNQFDNLNIYVERSKRYVEIGRNQTEAEAKEKDDVIKKALDDYKIPYKVMEFSRWTAERMIPEYEMKSMGWKVKPLKG